MQRAGALVAIAVCAVAAGCGGDAPAERDTPSTLDPKGTGAHVIAQEMWLQFAIGTAVWLLVVGLVVAVVLRRWRRDPDEQTWADEDGARRWVVLGGIVLPVVVLTVLVVVSARDLVRLQHPPRPPVLTVEVIGHRWWWEVRYPGTGIETANEIVVPVGQAVELQLESRDVIHSLWVPQLQRKLDLLPDRRTTTWLQANEGGVFRAVCSEFCGLEHARMHLVVQAMPAARFAQWKADEALGARPPGDAAARAGLDVFTSTSCAYCHAVRGTPAAGEVGPDLTHLASRLSLAGASLPNTRGYLAGWIADPQHQKPGALMPRTALEGQQLQSLLDYLETLR